MLRAGRQRGFTLVELLVSITLMALLMLLAAPNIGAWLQNSQIRTAADSILGGLQLAKSEAVRRNDRVNFQFTTSLDNGCALSTAGPNWVVSLDVATGGCGNTTDGDPPPAPRIVQRHAGIEGSANAVIAAGQSSLTFNGLGRLPAAAPAVVINVSTTAGTCEADGGKMRCLRINVTPAGQVRMCDPAISNAQDPRRC